jgi:hypothetical protein
MTTPTQNELTSTRIIIPGSIATKINAPLCSGDVVRRCYWERAENATRSLLCGLRSAAMA